MTCPRSQLPWCRARASGSQWSALFTVLPDTPCGWGARPQGAWVPPHLTSDRARRTGELRKPCRRGHIRFLLSCLLPVPVPGLVCQLFPPPSLLRGAAVSLQRKTELSFPQEPMTSQGGPTMSCGGRRPRSSRRPTSLWGIGATPTCSEPCLAPLLSVHLSVRTVDLSALAPLQPL